MWLFILTKVFINPGCVMSVCLTNITSITASTNKFINNLSTENTWIKSLYENVWRNLSLVKTSLTLTFLQNLLQSFSILFCVTSEYGYKRKIKISCFNIRHLNWQASCISLINSILEILLYDIICHHKKVLVLSKLVLFRYFLSNFYFLPNDNSSKNMKNVFYFI